MFGCGQLPCCALFSCQCLSKPPHVWVRTWECVLWHMHHSRWSYNKTATPRRQENPQILNLRETKLIDSYVWVWTVTFLYSIFLSVLVKATPCIDKDLGMCTMAYASLMVELQQDGYTSKTRESPNFEGNQADRFVCDLGVDSYLVVLYFPVSACQSHPMYR